jgi:hypothetical protein
VIRVLVMCVWTPERPFHPGPAPAPPAMVSVERANEVMRAACGEGRGARSEERGKIRTIVAHVVVSKCQVVHASLGRCGGVESAQNDVRDALTGQHVAADDRSIGRGV